MRALLVRVAADQSQGGGSWNGPACSKSAQFVYVAIPETSPTHRGLHKPYANLTGYLTRMGSKLPAHLGPQNMHIDPDFDHLTYGDGGERGKQIATKLGQDDLLVFYAGMQDIHASQGLIYALIGLYVIKDIVPAVCVPTADRDRNAHTRRILAAGVTDIVVRARPDVSGRLKRFIPIGNYRKRAYRVWPALLKTWGGLQVKDGYLQRSARLPEFVNAKEFYRWFKARRVPFVQRNN